jgi:hypothetical protein
MEEEAEDGGSAFPSRNRWDSPQESFDLLSPGMTLRDYFAGQALAGICYEYFSNDFNTGSAKADMSQAAHCAYLIADEMIAKRQEGRRSKTNKEEA